MKYIITESQLKSLIEQDTGYGQSIERRAAINPNVKDLENRLEFFSHVNPKVFDYIMMVSSFVPIIGPITRAVYLTYNLTNATIKFSKGDNFSAGLDVLFAFSPTFKQIERIGGKNILNLLNSNKVPIPVKNFLNSNFEKIRGEVNVAVNNIVKRAPAKLKPTPEQIKKLVDNGVDALASETSVKNISKMAASQIDSQVR